MALSYTDAKFNIRSGVWNKNGWIDVFFPSFSQIKTPLVLMNFDSCFSERAEGLKWRALTEKYLKQPLKWKNFKGFNNFN